MLALSGHFPFCIPYTYTNSDNPMEVRIEKLPANVGEANDLVKWITFFLFLAG
jgi:hypothetical protein